ncbi:hypothetical protein ALC56_12401 [Trachymyrmex septentrionalis]|uniref:Ig-like domain-containing protein n=1 Tax=Trachymyrmex septentrionalis TaxID=34720 RepID=A0A195EZB6_9HYME|nr:hypothetical protein ALC56_12401 [Trachymyrmex septentrionalis]
MPLRNSVILTVIGFGRKDSLRDDIGDIRQCGVPGGVGYVGDYDGPGTARRISSYIESSAIYRRRGIDTNCLIPVSDTPSFAITRLPGFGIPIVEGMSVSLKCEVDSNPASTPIWQRDNGPPPVEQSDDGWLNFTKITRAESGWYKCYTRHMLGIFTSIGYFLNVRCE